MKALGGSDQALPLDPFWITTAVRYILGRSVAAGGFGALVDFSKEPDPMDIALGAAIRLRRRSIGLSQQALAEQCDVSFQQIQKYENGANRISFSRMVLIARALKCRMRDLFHALELEEGPGADLNLLRKLNVPGSLDLLTAYEHLPPEARMPLLSFVRNVLPNGAPGREIQS